MPRTYLACKYLPTDDQRAVLRTIWFLTGAQLVLPYQTSSSNCHRLWKKGVLICTSPGEHTLLEALMWSRNHQDIESVLWGFAKEVAIGLDFTSQQWTVEGKIPQKGKHTEVKNHLGGTRRSEKPSFVICSPKLAQMSDWLCEMTYTRQEIILQLDPQVQSVSPAGHRETSSPRSLASAGSIGSHVPADNPLWNPSLINDHTGFLLRELDTKSYITEIWDN